MTDQTRSPVPEPGYLPTLPSLLRWSVELYGAQEYLVTPDDRLSFRDAAEASLNLAAQLVEHGIGKGSRVGLFMANSAPWVLAFLAAARLGAVVIPLSTFYKPFEAYQALRHADVEVLVTRTHVAGRTTEGLTADLRTVRNGRGDTVVFDTRVPNLRRILMLDSDATALAPRLDSRSQCDRRFSEIVAAMECDVLPSDPLSVILTSGSTGSPKAVVHTHGALVRHAFAQVEFQRIAAGRSTYVGAPFFWIGGLVPGVIAHLHFGGRILTQERLEPDAMVEFIAAERPQVLFGFNLIERLRSSAKFPVPDPDWLPAVGAAHKSADEALRYHNSLGMSETAGAHTGPGDEAQRELPENLRGSFGKPMPGIEHKVVEPGTDKLAGPCEIGEICVRGYSLMEGLYKQERADVLDADGWYHTGDLGYMKDGYLFFKGRLGEMIKTKGANVAPEEVRTALLRQPGVKDAVVLGVPDLDAGELVGAVLVVDNPDSFVKGALLASLKDQVSSYKVPQILICLDELPLLASGKPDRRNLTGILTNAAQVRGSC